MKCIVLVAYQTRKDIQKPLTLIIIKCQNNKIPFSTLPIHALHVQTVIVIYYRQACSSDQSHENYLYAHVTADIQWYNPAIQFIN